MSKHEVTIMLNDDPEDPNHGGYGIVFIVESDDIYAMTKEQLLDIAEEQGLIEFNISPAIDDKPAVRVPKETLKKLGRKIIDGKE